MKLIPASRAFATIRPEVASSAGPPNIMVPRQIGEIFRPLRPRERYCIGSGPSHAETVGRIALQDRHCEERSDEAVQSFLGTLDCFVASAPRNDGNTGQRKTFSFRPS